MSSSRARVPAALAALAALALFACPAPARAYDAYVSSTTLGQGYQLRAGDGLWLDRRRLTQELRLGVFNLMPGPRAQPGQPLPVSAEPRPTLSFAAALRFDSDFGLGDAELRQVPQLDRYRNAFSLLYAYFYGRNFLRGYLEWELGRQLVLDPLDWYAFDGGNVRLVLRRFHLTVEVFGGVLVNDADPLALRALTLDGYAITPYDPFSRQAHATVPTVGAAIATRGLRFLDARLSYRRSWSSTVDPEIYGAPAFIAGGQAQPVPSAALSGIVEEKLALSASLLPLPNRTTLRLNLAVRYNILLDVVDDLRGGATLELTPQHLVGIDYYRVLPTFSGDTLWNVFGLGPTEDVAVRYSYRPSPRWELSVRGIARFFQSSYAALPGGPLRALGGQFVRDGGGGVVAQYLHGLHSLRSELSWVGGYGGHRAFFDVSGRYPLWAERLRLEGRASWVSYEDDLRNPAPPRAGALALDASGHSFGLAAGVGWSIYRGILLHLLVEENVSTVYASQLRAVGLLDLTYWR